MLMSAAVQRWMTASGPIDMSHDMSTLNYRLTGPNIIERLHNAVRSAGERPLSESDITVLESGPPVTFAGVDAGDVCTYISPPSSPDEPVRVRLRDSSGEPIQTFERPPIMTTTEALANRALLTLGAPTPEQVGFNRFSAINWFPAGSRLRIPRTDDTDWVDRKAKAALWRYLNEQQREDLFCLGRFVVGGSESEMAYEILKGKQGNVCRDDAAKFCLTHGDLPVWDLMLAQKLMIEDNEPQFLEMANRLINHMTLMNFSGPLVPSITSLEELT